MHLHLLLYLLVVVCFVGRALFVVVCACWLSVLLVVINAYTCFVVVGCCWCVCFFWLLRVCVCFYDVSLLSVVVCV